MTCASPERDEFSSFRDPAGKVYWCGGEPRRLITASGLEDYRLLRDSGLARALVESGRLVPFEEIASEEGVKRLRLRPLPFLSYPYEWCFEQLQDAAVLTLDVMLASLDAGMVLKDASAYNVGWFGGAPVFLDHGSFTRYVPGAPWRAYRQFVAHFLAPLLLMRHCDVRLSDLLLANPDGLPLDLVSRLLPWRTWLSPTIAVHIHAHARMQARHAGDVRRGDAGREMPLSSLVAMVRSLRLYLQELSSPRRRSEWGSYYEETNYSEAAFAAKHELVSQAVEEARPAVTLDLGANNGEFSRVARGFGSMVVAADMDANAVSQLYCFIRGNEEAKLYPLRLNLDAPSPGVGQFNRERPSFLERAKGDMTLALALAHHLRIGGNWPISRIVDLLAGFAPSALVEFVPREDSQARRLLASREDIYGDWTLENFADALGHRFRKVRMMPISESLRTLILVRA